jgi:hypothetical protein
MAPKFGNPHSGQHFQITDHPVALGRLQVVPFEQQLSRGCAVVDLSQVLLQDPKRLDPDRQPRPVTRTEQLQGVPKSLRQKAEAMQLFE